jgi:predicted ATP-grasp superfamily ATP-dependent carboligase
MIVFVTDGGERSALAVTRSLGRRGHSVIVGSDRASNLSASSRYCARRVVYPSPHADPEGFRQFLFSFVANERVDVVMPVTDVTTRVVAAEQDRLRRHTNVAVPPLRAFEAVTDKATLVQHADGLGVPVPPTIVVSDRAHLRGVLSGVTFPAVVKPFQSRIQTANGWLGTSVHYAHTRDELVHLYDRHEYLASHPSLIQARIVGPGVGLFALFDRGRLVTAFAHRRLREKPPSGGVSVLRESVAPDQRLVDRANRLLGPLGWHGVAMVEYKRDAQTGEPFLMEVNGRFWGSLQLAVDAGVDFPALACQLAVGDSAEVPASYRIGVKSRWLLGDLDHLLLRVCRHDRDLQLPPGAPSRFQTCLAFSNIFERDVRFEILRRDDLGPFVREASDYATAWIRSAMGVIRRRWSRWTTASTPPVYDPNGYRHAGRVE